MYPICAPVVASETEACADFGLDLWMSLSAPEGAGRRTWGQQRWFLFITGLLPRLKLHPSVYLLIYWGLQTGQVLTQRYQTSIYGPWWRERKEVKKKGCCCWLRHRGLKYAHLHIQGCCLVPSGWKIKQRTGKKSNSKGQIVQGPEYQASNINAERHYHLHMFPSVHLKTQLKYHPFQKSFLNTLKVIPLSPLSLWFAFLECL